MKTPVSLPLLFLLSTSPLWAVPGQLENNDYKISLSETLPGIDSSNAFLPPDAAITVTVTDKFRSQQTFYPLKVYSIANYFLLGDTLNLVARTSLINNPAGPQYSFIQLNLSDPSNSRQFPDLRQYSLSPDQQNLLAVVDNPGGAPGIGLARLADGPAQLGWIYSEPAGVNLLRASFTAPVTALTLWAPAGWSADSLSLSFLFSVDDGTRDSGGKPVWKDYLADLELADKGWKVSSQAVDLSSYHFHAGAALTDLRFDGQKAALFLTQDNATNPVEVDFKPTPP
jgi:hypothetical protein